jgi:hypothetical protein
MNPTTPSNSKKIEICCFLVPLRKMSIDIIPTIRTGGNRYVKNATASIGKMKIYFFLWYATSANNAMKYDIGSELEYVAVLYKLVSENIHNVVAIRDISG